MDNIRTRIVEIDSFRKAANHTAGYEGGNSDSADQGISGYLIHRNPPFLFFFFITLGLELSDTKVYEP